MRPRRILVAVLLTAGLGCVLWAILHAVSRKTSESSAQSARTDDTRRGPRDPRLGGGAETPRTREGAGERGYANEPAAPRRADRQSAREKDHPALDLRIVTPVGHAPPEILLTAVVVGELWIHAGKVRPEADGWTRVWLPPRRGDGSATLILDAAGFAWSALRPVKLGIPGVQHYGDVLLDPGRTLTGRLVDDDGDGVGGASVTAFPPGIAPGRIGFTYPEPREGRTNDDGTFEIQHAPRGPCALRVRHAFHVAQPQTIPAETDSVDLRAHRAGHIWGSVGAKSGGGARIRLRAEPLDPTWAKPLIDGSDSYGRIRMGPLLPGRYRVMREMGERPGEPAGPDSPARPAEPIPDVEMGVVTVEAGKHTNVNWTVP